MLSWLNLPQGSFWWNLPDHHSWAYFLIANSPINIKCCINCTAVALRALFEPSFVQEFIVYSLSRAYVIEFDPGFQSYRTLSTWMLPGISLVHSSCHASGVVFLGSMMVKFLWRNDFHDLSFGFIYSDLV